MAEPCAGNYGPSAEQISEGRLSIRSSNDSTMPLHCGVSTRSRTYTSVELATASGLVLSRSVKMSKAKWLVVRKPVQVR